MAIGQAGVAFGMAYLSEFEALSLPIQAFRKLD
jgi:hypothetical protein